MRFTLRLLAAWLGLATLSLCAHPASTELSGAVRTFVASLSPEQKSQALFKATDDERENWHFVPKERRGLHLKDMTEAQRTDVLKLLRLALSAEGHAQVAKIMGLEQVLFEIEKRDIRNAGLYIVAIFGDPGSSGLWGWRFEGHHISLNFSLVGNEHVATTPLFFGANPAEVRAGPQLGTRALSREEDDGRALLAMFSSDQKAKVIFDHAAPKDIVTGNQRKISLNEPSGLAIAQMNPAQKAATMALVTLYVNRIRSDLAKEALAKIATEGWDKVYFAWAGGEQKGTGHYYRLQGPSFLLEYDNTQNNANHVHTVWRDASGDFARDVLSEHYAKEHSKG